MTHEAAAALRRRAETGDPVALTAYGKHLLFGAALAQQREGARLIARAAQAGGAEALAQQAVLVAAGIFNEPNLGAALDLLQSAAQRGWAPAQEDFRLLAGAEGEDYAAMRRAIDIGAWVSPPRGAVAVEAPRIVTAPGLMRDAECRRLIAKASNKLMRASVYDPGTGGEAIADDRSNTRAEISLADFDVPYVLLLVRMSALLGLPPACFEPANVLHYRPGEEFKPHFDFLSPDQPGFAANVQTVGQRVVTLLVYLNDDYEGGETQFPRLNYAYKGGAGDALMFGNVTPQGAPDPLTLHAGLPPRSGEKWLLSQWVRNRSARAAASG